MKTNQILAMGLFMAMLVLSAGCQTAPMTARTTIAPMPGVGHLTSVKRTTEVTSSTTNITMVESIKSPEQGQFELKKAELAGRTKIGVAKASQSSSGGFWATPSPYYYGGGGYYSSGGYYGNGGGYVNRGEAGVNYHYGGGSGRSGGGYVNRGEGGVNYTYGRR